MRLSLTRRLALTATVWGVVAILIQMEIVKGFLPGAILGGIAGPITTMIWFI